MITPGEENFLRRFIREHTPMAVSPGPPVPPPRDFSNDAQIDAQIDRMSKLKAVDADDDHEMKMRVGHTLRPGEKLGQWYARTGLGRVQALAMTKDEITRFVELRDADNTDDCPREPRLNLNPFAPPSPATARRGGAVLGG